MHYSYGKTYTCIIEAKTEEWQLKVEILMKLWIRSMNATLIIAIIVWSAFVKEPI